MHENLNKPKNRKIKWLILGVVLLLLILGVAALAVKKLVSKQQVQSEYQAVFLTNGQVYFGKLDLEGRWIKLRDIYYLQVSKDLQPASSGEQTPTATPTASNADQQQIQLVKLGSELHGPEDEMFIAKDKILFWENMKDNSKVLESIRQYKNK